MTWAGAQQNGDTMTGALYELVALCKSGLFYEDHDESLHVLAEAEKELDLLDTAIRRHDSDREAGQCQAPLTYYVEAAK